MLSRLINKIPFIKYSKDRVSLLYNRHTLILFNLIKIEWKKIYKQEKKNLYNLLNIERY